MPFSRAVLATLAAFFLATGCRDDRQLTEPVGSEGNGPQIVVTSSDTLSGSDPLFLRAPRRVSFGEASLMILPFPDDTAYEVCRQDNDEFCKEQGETWTGHVHVTCLSGPGQCGSPTYTWQLVNAPPGTEVSFDPDVTVIEQETEMRIEIDNDAETGVVTSVPTATPTDPQVPVPGTADFIFHTLCSWGLGTCPYGEIRDLMGAGYPSVSVSAAGEQDRLIGERMNLRVQHKGGTGEHQFNGEEFGWLVQWDGPGQLIYGYDINAPFLQVFPWPEGIGTQDTISYYHVTRDLYTVWGQADLSYDNDEAEVRVLTKAVFDVDGPTNPSLTSQTVPSMSLGAYGGFPDAIHFGGPNPVGIRWTFTATAPAGDNGYVAATQLANATANRMDTTGHVFHDLNTGGYVLDGCSLYDNATQRAGSSYAWTSSDSPGLGLLPSDSLGDFAAQFQTYFMYRPAGYYSIWVPIGQLDWYANGEGCAAGRVQPGHAPRRGGVAMRFSSIGAAMWLITSATTTVHVVFSNIAAAQVAGSPRSDGLQVRIQLSGSRFQAGDPIRIRLTLVNQSSEPQPIASVPPQALARLHVYTEAGKEVRPTPPSVSTMSMRPPRPLAPGGERTLRSKGEEWLDLREWGYDLRIPGKYTITGNPLVGGPPAEVGAKTARSNEATFTIGP